MTREKDDDIQDPAVLAPYSSGCEILNNISTPKNLLPSPLQKIRDAFHHSSQYFSINYLGHSRGYGAIAVVDIPKHTLILDEPPLIPWDKLKAALEDHESGVLSCHDDDTHFLHRYFSDQYKEFNLEQGVKESEVQGLIDLFWSMHDQYAIESDIVSKKRIWGVNFSNAFFTPEASTTKHTANQPSASKYHPTIHFIAAKLNHSCRPNVGYDFSQSNQRMITTRDVKKGEELCDCYSDVVYHEPAWVRRIFLQQKYNFDCCCEACALSSVYQEESDERRLQLKDIAKSLSVRIDATFLYNHQFSLEVQRVVGELDDSDEETYGYEDRRNDNTNYLSSSKLKPTSDDLYDLLEYMRLLQAEGIDHDIIECTELAFDLAVFLDQNEILQQYQLGSNTLKLYEMTKGEKHKLTRKFRKKREKAIRHWQNRF